MAPVHHLEFLKFVTAIAALFCFPMQSFTEIGQSSDELWPKNDF